MLRNRLFRKIFISYLVLLGISGIAFMFFARSVIKDYTLGTLSYRLRSCSELINQLLAPHLHENKLKEVTSLCKGLSNEMDICIIITDFNGKIITRTNNMDVVNSGGRMVDFDAISGKGLNEMVFSSQLQSVYMLNHLTAADGKDYAIFISLPLKAYQEDVERTMKKIAFYTIIIIMASTGAGFVFIRIKTKPLSDITQIAHNFIRGDFSRKADPASANEMRDLAIAVNSIGSELQSRTRTIINEKNKFDSVMANMHDAIIITDLQERITLINAVAKAFFGVSSVSLNKDYFWEKVRYVELCNLLKETITRKADGIYEIEVTFPKKRLLKTHFSFIQLDQDTQGVLLVSHDITEVQKFETTRREFVANVSHELRTPLASIKGYLETLLENHTTDQDQTREFLQIIMKHASRLDNLIKDILELSRLDTGYLQIKLLKMDILPCIEQIVSLYKERCGFEGKIFECKISCPLPTVETDEYLLRQLLTNLIDNAIKYTSKGGRIGVKVNPFKDIVQFEICDTGIGIPQEHIPRIFERFYRVDPARSREMGGTGLGLSIVKHIVNLHHGSVKVESAVNAGSKFIITLPQQQPK